MQITDLNVKTRKYYSEQLQELYKKKILFIKA